MNYFCRQVIREKFKIIYLHGEIIPRTISSPLKQTKNNFQKLFSAVLKSQPVSDFL